MWKLLYCDSVGKIGSVGLLVLRLVMGAAFMHHGWGKIQNPMGWMGPEATMPAILQALAAISEFGGGLALIAGLLTRLGSLGITERHGRGPRHGPFETGASFCSGQGRAIL